MKFVKVRFYLLLISALLLLNTGYAAESPVPPNAKLAIQNFKYYPLDIQFRYVDGKLTYIRFTNLSTQPVSVDFFHNRYILGPQDYTIINPPNTKFFYYVVTPYKEFQTAVDNIFPYRFGSIEMFSMPNSSDNRVEK